MWRSSGSSYGAGEPTFFLHGRLINNDEEIRRWIEIADCAKTWLAAVSRCSRVGFGVLACRQSCWNVRLMEHSIRRQGREAVELKLSQQQTGLRPVIREKRSVCTCLYRVHKSAQA
uniref:Uncharacterized protein n=1 Tax=Coccidioides posadasii RMSCC 3488 TaxID=454284 RepID=A0A0J6FBM2_COCPO|nr:hypothetical protein CPAG_02698 [Coccidioides posadasii RMSCC 3488]